MAARACPWAADSEGDGGALELTGVEVSKVFTASPTRRAGNATLEVLAQNFTAPRQLLNIAVTTWHSGKSRTVSDPRYLVGKIASAEAGPIKLQIRLRKS